MSTRQSLFQLPPPPEVPLARAPLERVIAEIRFPLISAINGLDFITPFQEPIRGRYPILRKVMGSELLMGPRGVITQPGASAWCLRDQKDIWHVTLTADSVALETVEYSSRGEFFERMSEILEAFLKLPDLSTGYDRFGVRYVNRVRMPVLEDLPRLVRPEVLGIAGDVFGAEREFTVCESSFAVDADAELRSRWGLLPAGATTDPKAIDLLDEPSWILDLDMFIGSQPELEVSTVIERGLRFAEKIYTLFRWCVTDDFLRAYGGTP